MIEQILNFLAFDVWTLLTCSACTSGSCKEHTEEYFAERYPGRGKIIDGAQHFRRLMADVCTKPETQCDKKESDVEFDECEMDKYLEEFEKKRQHGGCDLEDDEDDDDEDAKANECKKKVQWKKKVQCQKKAQCKKSAKSKSIDKAVAETVVIKCSQSSIDELFGLEARAEELYREYTTKESASKCAAPEPWHRLKSWHKVSYYWAAMTGEIPKTDPYKNFERFYSAENECGFCRPAHEARAVWAQMDMESRMPFVLEAFIGRMALDQVNVDDEHDIERCFTALLARAERVKRRRSKSKSKATKTCGRKS